MFSLLDDTTRIYILCGYTDFRKGMDSLTQMAVEHGVEIQKNSLVLFMSVNVKVKMYSGELLRKTEDGDVLWS